MPKLPVASGQDVVSALIRLGFQQVRQRGSHVIMRRGSAGCSVPMHREIRRGTLGSIIKQAEITVEELMTYFRAPNRTYRDYRSQDSVYAIGARVMRLLGLELGGKR